MSWTEREHNVARHFFLAMADVLRQTNLRVETTPELDQQAKELVLQSVREMRTLAETTQQFIGFARDMGALVGEVPENIHEQMERAFQVREMDSRQRDRDMGQGR